MIKHANIRLYFACCARDCADKLLQNVEALLNISNIAQVSDLKVFIVENDSVDNTRNIILNLAAQDNRVIPILLESIDKKFASRESRIAFCRDYLLKYISSKYSYGLYCPIDLDLDLDNFRLGTIDAFLTSCEIVINGFCNGVFPSSFPFYYDIYALRAQGWCMSCCWEEVNRFYSRSVFVRLLANIRYIALRQRYYLSLQSSNVNLIPVVSAFGGLAVYSLNKVIQTGASYSIHTSNIAGSDICEHVIFNSYLDKLFINPFWLVKAPSEHIEFRLMNFIQKLKLLAGASFSDMKRIAQKLASLISHRK